MTRPRKNDNKVIAPYTIFLLIALLILYDYSSVASECLINDCRVKVQYMSNKTILRLLSGYEGCARERETMYFVREDDISVLLCRKNS